jgi:hypothetical protein
MDDHDLSERLRTATVLGGPAAGTLIAPETIRRLSCDAAIIPAVLGSKGEVLDLGRAMRFFTPAQLKILWLRDEAEHHCPRGRVDVEPDDVDQLGFEVGSLLILKPSTFHGLRLWSDQILATESFPIPTRAAIVRVVQCVEPSAGRSCRVSLSTSATVPSGREGFRPRPLAITPTPAVPFSVNRLRQRRTASESTPQRRAISSFATPSAAISKALA